MGFMSPSTPSVPEPVAVPTLSDAEISTASEDEKQKRQKQKGRASTTLSGASILGDDSDGTGGTASTGSGLATKTLLGS